jgi:hypothetical protein
MAKNHSISDDTPTTERQACIAGTAVRRLTPRARASPRMNTAPISPR